MLICKKKQKNLHNKAFHLFQDFHINFWGQSINKTQNHKKLYVLIYWQGLWSRKSINIKSVKCM